MFGDNRRFGLVDARERERIDGTYCPGREVCVAAAVVPRCVAELLEVCFICSSGKEEPVIGVNSWL